jgi:hypothetical protein
LAAPHKEFEKWAMTAWLLYIFLQPFERNETKNKNKKKENLQDYQQVTIKKNKLTIRNLKPQDNG